MKTAEQILEHLLNEIKEGKLNTKNLIVSYSLPSEDNQFGIFYIETTNDYEKTLALMTASLHLMLQNK